MATQGNNGIPKRYRDAVALFNLELREFRQNTEKSLDNIGRHLATVNDRCMKHAGEISANKERSENTEKTATNAEKKADDNRKLAITSLITVIGVLLAGIISLVVIAF